jgi:hypothetical protein
MPSTPEPFRSARKNDLVKVQRDPGIRRKCKPAAQPGALGRSDVEPIADDYAGLRIHMTKMFQRHRRFGKLRDPEELVVRCQLRYLPDVLAELRHQPGRGFIGASGLPEHVAKNNTRFSRNPAGSRCDLDPALRQSLIFPTLITCIGGLHVSGVDAIGIQHAEVGDSAHHQMLWSLRLNGDP